MALVVEGGARGQEVGEDAVVSAEGALEGGFEDGEGRRVLSVGGEVAGVHLGEGGERVCPRVYRPEHLAVCAVDGDLDGEAAGGGGAGGGGLGGGTHGDDVGGICMRWRL